MLVIATVQCKRLMHSPGLHSILQQVHGICSHQRLWPQHSRSSCRWIGHFVCPGQTAPPWRALIQSPPDEPPSGLVEGPSTMGQVEPNLDLPIAIQVQRGSADIEEDPKRSTRLAPSHDSGHSRAVPSPQQKGQVGQVLLRPLRTKQHEHIVATKLPKHLQ